ncbi:hypothetical protein Aduo_007295 [Ancylostoma duodenale]
MDRKLLGQNCVFDGDIVNSVTITSLFPETGYCDSVSGTIRIDETTNLTHQQLTDALGRVGLVMGKVEIVNTAFTNLSFFRDLYAVTGIIMDDVGYSLIIMNNLKLETMSGALLVTYPNAHIEGNPLLDPNCTHIYQYYSTKRRIRKNRLNCGCELDGPLTNANIHEVDDNCDLILGNLIIHGANSPPHETLVKKFTNATLITGEISIVDTNYTDLGFFKSVREIKVFYDDFAPVFVEKFLRIEGNSVLEKLSWPNLEYLHLATIRITRNPSICYTTRELGGLLNTQYIELFEGRICEGKNAAVTVFLL